MAIALVQHTTKDQASAVSNTTLAYTSNVAANNLLVIAVRAGTGTGQTITITDTVGNSWTNGSINIDVAGGQSQQISWVVNTTSAANTVTITLNTAASMRIAIYEYSGTATSSPMDIQANIALGTSTTPSSSSFTPNANNELVFAIAGLNAASTFTAGTNFALQDAVPSGSAARLGIEHWIQTTATAALGDFSITSSQQWMAGYAVFKPVGAVSNVVYEDDSFSVILTPPVEPNVSVW